MNCTWTINFVQFKLVSTLGKAHVLPPPPPPRSLRSFPNVAFEMVPMFVWEMMALWTLWDQAIKTITEVFIKSGILSVETILSTYTYTGTCTHEYTDYTKLTHKQRLEAEEDGAWNRKHCRSIVLEKEMCSGLICRSLERVSVGEDGKGCFMWMDRQLKTEKAQEPTVENLVQQIWSSGGCVKLKTIMEMSHFITRLVLIINQQGS